MKKKFPIGKKRKDRKTVNEKPDENILEKAEEVPEESPAENAPEDLPGLGNTSIHPPSRASFSFSI